MGEMRVAAVIPARWGSTRLPAKVLADLGGKPVIRRVWENCVSSGLFTRVIVATDHEEVRDAARGFGAESAMTSAAHNSGTERVAEVAASLEEEIVVNVQGDEPFLGSEVLAPLVSRARLPGTEVATPVTPVSSGEELADPGVVKVLFDARGEALCFSRWPIPFCRDRWSGNPWEAARRADPMPPGVWWKHLGIYAFRRETLLGLVILPPAPAEEMERLEQLRWLHHGARIACVPVAARGVSIDTPADLERARRML